MAEIVSLSQCPIGIGPCCLRMSARALGRQKKKGKNVFSHSKNSVFVLAQSVNPEVAGFLPSTEKKATIAIITKFKYMA